MKRTILSLIACVAMLASGAAFASGHDEGAIPTPAPTAAPEAPAVEVAQDGGTVQPQNAPEVLPGAQAPDAAAFVASAALAVCLALVLMPPPVRRRLAYVGTYRIKCFAYDMRRRIGDAVYGHLHNMGALLYVFPQTVTTDIAFGVVGEWFLDGPQRSQPARISHNVAADIVVGRWFTQAADGTVRPGGAGAVGGVFMNPKVLGSIGTSGGGPLAPTLTVPTGTIGEFAYMGSIVVAAPAAVAIGNAAKYDTTTGVIGVGAPGGGEAAIPNARFVRYANAAAGLAVLELTN